MLGHSLAIVRPALCWVLPRIPLGTSAKNRTEIVQVTAQSGMGTNRIAPTYKKWGGVEAAQPARISSSLGFVAKYAAQLMDYVLTPIPIDLSDLKR